LIFRLEKLRTLKLFDTPADDQGKKKKKKKKKTKKENEQNQEKSLIDLEISSKEEIEPGTSIFKIPLETQIMNNELDSLVI